MVNRVFVKVRRVNYAHSPNQNVQQRRCVALIKALTRNRLGLTKSEILKIYTQEKILLPSPRTFHRDIDEMWFVGYKITYTKPVIRRWIIKPYKICLQKDFFI